MDFTALELGLRNRQLLQVKCFLKIQIETFRYFLAEELTSLATAEQTITFEKFLHDWQNVVNKVSSVAAIQMSGDYSSKIFSILLYRSLIHSCNQLILIVSSSKTLPENVGHVFIKFGFNISPLSNDDNNHQWFIFKEKILMLLIKQINSIRENLSRVNYSEINLTTNHPQRCITFAEEDTTDLGKLKIENLLKNDCSDPKMISVKNEKFQELLEYSLINQCIPLFIWVMKKYSPDNSIDKQLQWKNLVEKIVNFTSTKIKSNDVDLKLIEEINTYLTQTGFPTFDLLFSLFIQTCNACIRQKLLHIFSICFSDDFSPNYQSEIISKSGNFEKFKSNFGDYFQLMSIIDMYIFCHRPKMINDDDRLEISIEWIIKIKSNAFSLSKALIIPVLNEISIHPTLFDDWQELTAQIYNQIIFDPFRQFIFIEEKFDSFINAENLWQFFIDNNLVHCLIEWIQKDYFQMPYCSKIQPTSHETCRKMLQYLMNKSSIIVKHETMTALICNSYFFNQYDFIDLISEILSFENFLKMIGQTNIFAQTIDNNESQGYLVLDKLLNKVIKLSELIEYCIKNRLFEFLFLLYNRYKIDFDFLTTSDSFKDHKNIKNVLQFLSGLYSPQQDILENSVFEKSFFIQRFLNDDLENQTLSFKENIKFLFNLLASKSIDLDFILFLLSFSEQQNFDDLFVVLKQLGSEEQNCAKSFLNNLNSKYPLIFRAFQDSANSNEAINSKHNLIDEISSSPQQVCTYNIYTFLQQSIPFVKITKIFKWQIDRDKKSEKLQKQNQNSTNEMPHFSLKQLTELYGIKANLTTSYYLNNLRLIEAFLTFTTIKTSNERQIRSMETRSIIINEKLAIKAIRKSATIAYSSIKNESIATSCLLFQMLIRSCLTTNVNNKNNTTRSYKCAGDAFAKNVSNECEKFQLHLALGRLIIEYAADFLHLQGSQQQQNVLASLLRRSHFNGNRTCTQKLLDLATISIERKFNSNSHVDSSSKMSKIRKSNIDVKLLELFIESSMETNDQQMDSIIESCPLLIECFQWKPLFMFANLYGLKKPLNFLDKCTGEDNWLAFVIFAQLYEIPKEEIQSMLTDADFNNPCIGEHLDKAFQSSRHVVSANQNEIGSKILKSNQPASSSRNVLYSKLFKEKSPTNPMDTNDNIMTSSPIDVKNTEKNNPEKTTFSFDGDSQENMSLFSSSVFSRISDDTIPNNYVVFEQKLTPNVAAKDFLQLILDIYANCVSYSQRISCYLFSIEISFQITLLYASVSLSNPILALLSCSLSRTTKARNIDIQSPIQSPNSLQKIKKSNESKVESPLSPNSPTSSSNSDRLKYTAFACWLLASVDQPSKQSYIDWYCRTHSIDRNQDSLIDCYTNWSPERVLNLISVLTSNNVKNFQVISQGLDIFQIKIPILNTLLNFFIRFLLMKDYYDETIDLLIQFQSSLMEYNEEDFLQTQGISSCNEPEDFITNETDWMISDFYTKFWIEKCSLIMITNSLLIAKQFEMGILLSHYNFVRIQDCFSSDLHRIPDIRTIYLFSQCLNKLPNYQLPIADLLMIEMNTDEPESKYAEVLRSLIFDLQESDHFEAARNIINLLNGANTTELIINEWMLKAKKAEMDKKPNPLGTSSSCTSSINMDLSFWENCWSQVNKLDPSMHSAFKVMQRFVQQLEPSQILIQCFVLLKCLMAVETMLKDSIDNNDNDNVQTQNSSINQDDSSTVCSSNTSNTADLMQDYFNLEISLWKSVVECEFYIQTTFNNDDLNEKPTDPIDCNKNCDNFLSAWREIWKDIVSFFSTSIISKVILPKFNEKYPLSYKHFENQRNKQMIILEVFKHDSLNKVIGNLLDFFCYEKAQEVSKLFNYVHEDFEIIQACDQTARGFLKDISDAPLSVQLKLKHCNISNQLINSKTIVTGYNCSNLNSDQKKIVSMLQTFSNFATIGQKFCEYILLRYNIACLLGKTYSELNDSDHPPGKILEMLLASNQINDNKNNSDNSNLIHDDDDGGGEPKPQQSSEDDFSFNHSSLLDKYMETILCAKEFIRVVGRVDEKFDNEEKILDILAQFVYQNVQQIVDRQFKDSLNDSINTQLQYTEIELDRTQLEFNSARFSVLIRLLREPSLLGHKLLELAKKMKTSFENNFNDFQQSSICYKTNKTDQETAERTDEIFMIAKRKHYVQMVEMYIRAHECFTSQCLVSGIALVLRKTRLLITRELQPARYFHLILRLLTGIGRYSEMTYCFDLFRECDRFELILSKRVQRTPQLRIALLNYLKNAEHIDELLPLVAIRFFLYRETADHHKSRAEKLLKELNLFNFNLSTRSSLGRSLTKKNSSNSLYSDSLVSHSPPSFNLSSSISNVNNWNFLKEQLETIMYEYQEAEINYTKAASYSNADHCSRQAQLIALQLYYINKSKSNEFATNISSTVVVVVKLDPNQVKDFINACNNFYEAFIVFKSYPEVDIEWADAFFNNAVINNNTKYCQQFLETQEISITFLEKLIKRFEIFSTMFHQQKNQQQQLLQQSQTSSFINSNKSPPPPPQQLSSSSSSMNQSPSAAIFIPSSPLPTSLLSSLSQIRSEIELKKIYQVLEQIIECIICDRTTTIIPLIQISLKERYRLAKKLNSQKLMQRFLENNNENFAYLLDLKSNSNL